MPIIFLLSEEGLLCGFYVINQAQGAVQVVPQSLTAPNLPPVNLLFPPPPQTADGGSDPADLSRRPQGSDHHAAAAAQGTEAATATGRFATAWTGRLTTTFVQKRMIHKKN